MSKLFTLIEVILFYTVFTIFVFGLHLDIDTWKQGLSVLVGWILGSIPFICFEMKRINKL